MGGERELTERPETCGEEAFHVTPKAWILPQRRQDRPKTAFQARSSSPSIGPKLRGCLSSVHRDGSGAMLGTRVLLPMPGCAK